MDQEAYLWVGSLLVVVGLGLIAISRPSQVEKLGVGGIEWKLNTAVAFPGYKVLLLPGVIVLLLGIVAVSCAGAMKAFPQAWPTRFSRLKSAEIQLSDVDDLLLVRVNRTLVAEAKYGETPDWIDVKDRLHQGSNAIEVIVQN